MHELFVHHGHSYYLTGAARRLGAGRCFEKDLESFNMVDAATIAPELLSSPRVTVLPLDDQKYPGHLTLGIGEITFEYLQQRLIVIRGQARL